MAAHDNAEVALLVDCGMALHWAVFRFFLGFTSQFLHDLFNSRLLDHRVPTAVHAVCSAEAVDHAGEFTVPLYRVVHFHSSVLLNQ